MEKRLHRPGSTSLAEEDGQNRNEKHLVDAIDNRDAIRAWLPLIKNLKKKLKNSKIDVTGFLQESGKYAAVELLNMAITAENDRVKLSALTEILDRGGNSKVNKVAIAHANVDRNATKEELKSLIRGLAKQTKAIEIDNTQSIEGGIVDANLDEQGEVEL